MERRAVQVLRGVLVGFAAIFALTRIPVLDEHTPRWAAAVLINGVCLLAAGIVLLRARRPDPQRVSWLLIGGGLLAYGTGTAFSWVYTWNGAILPFPSLSDLSWLMFYPLTYAGILSFLREQAPTRRTLLDGAITGLGGAAVFSALVIDVLVEIRMDGTLDQALALAYPLGDSLLLGTLLARLAVRRWVDPSTALILTGFGLFVLADTSYVMLTSRGEYVPGGLTDVAYLCGITLIGLAAWLPPHPGTGATDRNRLGLSVWFGFGALIVLVVATRVHMSAVTVALAGLTLLAVLGRVLVTVRELEVIGRVSTSEARRDQLTGLANRRAVMERLDHLPGTTGTVALLLLDLDRFKQVNDVHGHQAGDDLLRQVALRMAEMTRANDLLGRLGGDEFVLVLTAPGTDEAGAVLVAERIRERLRTPFELATVTVEIDASIGVALRTDGDAGLLLHEADAAMYEAKRAGGGHVVRDATTVRTP